MNSLPFVVSDLNKKNIEKMVIKFPKYAYLNKERSVIHPGLSVNSMEDILFHVNTIRKPKDFKTKCNI